MRVPFYFIALLTLTQIQKKGAPLDSETFVNLKSNTMKNDAKVVQIE